MAANGEFTAILQELPIVACVEEEIILLGKLRESLRPAESTANRFTEDECEAQWLSRGLDLQDDPFPGKQPESLCESQDELNTFTFYLFERRFGWSEYLTMEDLGENLENLEGRSSSASSVKVPDDTRCKGQLNDLLDEFLKWYLAQNLSLKLLESFQHSISQASSMPVVRNQTFVHVMDWLKQTCDQGFSPTVFPIVKSLIVSGITDVWSAIRNTCIARLPQSLDHFSLQQAQEFYTDLIRICQAKESSWQATEGAVMGQGTTWLKMATFENIFLGGMTTLVRRFCWTGQPANSDSDSSEYMLKFGECKQSTLPSFIVDSVHSVLYSLLAHPQLSIRDHATKAFSSIFSRCEFQEAFAAFEEVVKRLCRGTQSPESTFKGWHLPHLAVLRPDFKFLQACEAEGLLGVCVFLIKHIPPGFLLPNWPRYFSTFNLYLMHPASTVRQATSAVFKILVAKDSSSPVLLKLVLQGLAAEWEVDEELLLQHLDADHTRDSHSTTPRVSPVQERYRGVSSAAASTPSPPPDTALSCSGDSTSLTLDRGGSPLVADGGEGVNHGWNSHRRPSSQLGSSKHQRISIRAVSKLLTDQPSMPPEFVISGAWEWREGRLLAYELILKFLIANHIHYLFPTFALPRTNSLASASVDENLIGSACMNDDAYYNCITNMAMSPTSCTYSICVYSNADGTGLVTSRLRHKSEYSPPSHLKSNSFGSIAYPIKDGFPVREAWIKRPKRASSFSTENDLSATSTRKLIRQYSVSCQGVLPRRPFRPPKSQGLELANSLLSQSKAVDKTERSPQAKTPAPVNGMVRCMRSPLANISSINGECVNLDDDVFHKSRPHSTKPTTSQFHGTPQWAASLELETLASILFQDPESCGQAALNVVCEIKTGLRRWTKKVYDVLGHTAYDKLTVVAMETTMLAHIFFSPSKGDKKQKCDAEERVLNIILNIFSFSFPEQPLGRTIKAALKSEQSSFCSPTDGFLSCCSRSPSSERHAQQFGKYLISEISYALAKFLKTCEVHTVILVFPVLVHYIGVFPEDSKICHSLVDGLQYILQRTKELMTAVKERKELDQLVKTYFSFALSGISSIISVKTLDLPVVRQVLDVFVKVCEFLHSPHLGQIVTAISTRLDYEPDLVGLMGEEPSSRTETPDLYILSNDIPTSPVDEAPLPVDEDDDDEQVNGLRMLPESVALDRSHESGRGTPHLPAGDDDASDGSDWDSWEDEDEEMVNKMMVNQEMMNQEMINQEMVNQEMENQKIVNKMMFIQVMVNKMMVNQEMVNKMMVNKMMVNQVMVNKMMVNQEMVNKMMMNQEMVNKMMMNQEMVNREMVNQEIMNQEIMNQEIMNQEMMNQEMVNREMMNQEMVNQEIVNKMMVNREMDDGDQEMVNKMMMNKMMVNQEMVNKMMVNQEMVNRMMVNQEMDHSALVAVFADFLQNLQTLYDAESKQVPKLGATSVSVRCDGVAQFYDQWSLQVASNKDSIAHRVSMIDRDDHIES
ncbi:predicted protein [Nematostella vectensis]|uniref:Uncharacterized protein n=1 Tax=Nematostella vectensis TaxID=45351 RepID=A7T070_NEMVE|nr:predicted protein [Nematostella vectensis]|eukprot:XP_001622742.1 predicted protein [Nematostella vectensis]